MTTQEAWNQAQQDGPADGPLQTNMREFIIGTVVDASTFATLIAEKLAKGEMHNISLSTDEAHRFITQDAQPLARAGFTVELPPLWSQDNRRHPLSFEAQVRHVEGTINFQTLFNYDSRISLGDDPITEAELSTLAKASESLVKIRDRWLDMQNRKLRAVIQSIARRSQRYATAGQLIQMNIEAALDLPKEFNQAVVAQGLIGRILRVTAQHEFYQLIKPPEDLSHDLRAYQHRGYSWLNRLTSVNLGACLADDMGLGKTIQTLGTLLQKAQAGQQKPALIIVPTSTVRNWLNEADKFTPQLRMAQHHGPARAKTESELREQLQTTDALVTSYGTAVLDADLLSSVQWSGVVLDEAQNVKNPSAARAKACRAMPAQYRIALTGTPVQNHAGDLRSIMNFLNPGLLRHTAPQRREQSDRSTEGRTKLRDATRPFILRRLKTDPEIKGTLPERIEANVACALTVEQAALYEATLQDLEHELQNKDAFHRGRNILAVITRLKQICNHPAQFLRDDDSNPERSGKMTRLTELMEEIVANDEKAVIFTEYVRMAKVMQLGLEQHTGQRPHVFHGQLSTEAREQMTNRFAEQQDQHALIVSLRAGGTGINLTAANHVFHYDRWWNPAVENQATDRVHRIGQTKTVQVHKLICAGTLEEHIDRVIRSKAHLGDELVSAGDDWLREMSNEDIRQALRLEAHISQEEQEAIT